MPWFKNIPDNGRIIIDNTPIGGLDRTFFKEDIIELFKNPEVKGFIIRRAELVKTGFTPTPFLSSDLEPTLILIGVKIDVDREPILFATYDDKKIVVPCPPLNHPGGFEVT